MCNVGSAPQAGNLFQVASHLTSVFLFSRIRGRRPVGLPDVIRIIDNSEILVYISKVKDKSTNFYCYVMTESGEFGYVQVDNLEPV